MRPRDSGITVRSLDGHRGTRTDPAGPAGRAAGRVGGGDADVPGGQGRGAALGRPDGRGRRRAGGSIGPVVGGGGGGGSGPVPSLSEKDWKALGKDIGTSAPTCDDLVALGRVLQKHGFVVGENAAFGPVGSHDPGGYHYKCG